jgi:alpha-D-ribose 1-methylphosphonate 5-triphosphate synthase subunit PhnL
MTVMLSLDAVGKDFTLHTRGGLRIPVFEDVSFEVAAGEAAVLEGPSGCGKSTLMRMIYGNYRCPRGSIRVRHDGALVNLSGAAAHLLLDVRDRTLGYVSQFMRVVPRVATLDIVAEPLRRRGLEEAEANRRAGAMLERLNLPSALWALPPATFSGGEQQRVNIAHGLIAGHPVLLLDEPTASLDAGNRAVVADLIAEARESGTAIVGIFHDAEVREAVSTRGIDMTRFAARAAEAAE